MLGSIGSPGFSLIHTNQDNRLLGAYGTAVTPGASGVKGSWVEIASSATVTADVYVVRLKINLAATAAVSRPLALDLGIDPAGGTSYTVLVPDMLCGGAVTAVSGGVNFELPIFIPRGASIAVRAASGTTTVSSFRVGSQLFGGPTRPEYAMAGQYAEAVGITSGAIGTSITPGSSGVDGSWVSLGTTVQDLWAIDFGMHCNSTDVTAAATVLLVDIAVGDATNKHIIIDEGRLGLPNTSETFYKDAYHTLYDVPAGSTLYARATCIATLTDTTNWNIAVIGVGG